MTEEIRSRQVLTEILLHTLSEHPDGLATADVYDYIDRRYTFPEQWYRQLPESPGYRWLKEHGYDDWRTIPQGKLVELVKTEPMWQNEIRWARNTLRKEEYLDGSAPRGIWKLSAKGSREVREGVALELTPSEREAVDRFKQEAPEAERSQKQPSLPGSGSRASLLGALQLLTHSMPVDDLELLVEIARVIRRRSLADEE